MSKKFQLQIPTPCHENWDNMSPVEKGRFCSSCQKQVVDFSNMSDREVAMFFKKPSTGSVCGRFMQDQLDRDMEIPRKRIPWVKYFFQFLLPGFLVSMKATAQGNVKLIKKDSSKVECTLPTMGKIRAPLMGDTIAPSFPIVATGLGIKRASQTLGFVTARPFKIDSTIIKGKVVDEQGNPFFAATIMIKNTHVGTQSDAEGNFKLKQKPTSNDITLVFSSVGYEMAERKIQTNKYSHNINVTLTTMRAETMGMYILVKKVEKKTDTKKEPEIKPKSAIKTPDIDQQFFKAYPNPIKSNSTLHIEWNQTENGYHVLQLFNLQDQLVFTKEIFIDEEAKLLTVDLPSLTTGSYVLKMTNKKTIRSYTSKILVQ